MRNHKVSALRQTYLSFAIILLCFATILTTILTGCGETNQQTKRAQSLIHDLNSSDKQIQLQAIFDLAITGRGNLGREESPVLDALDTIASHEDDNPELSSLAVAAIYILDPRGKLGPRNNFSLGLLDESVHLGLIAMARADDPALAQVAMEALGWHIWAKFPRDTPSYFQMTVNDPIMEDSIDILIDGLSNSPPEVRRNAALAIGLVAQHQKLIPSIVRAVSPLEKVSIGDADDITRGLAKIILGIEDTGDPDQKKAMDYWDKRWAAFWEY